MIKQEFDNASREAGYGACADYMWNEVETCYSASDRIDRDLMVYIYWNEPGIYRTILEKRHEATQLVAKLASKSDGYRFAEMQPCVKALDAVLCEIDYAIDSAIFRRSKKGR